MNHEAENEIIRSLVRALCIVVDAIQFDSQNDRGTFLDRVDLVASEDGNAFKISVFTLMRLQGKDELECNALLANFPTDGSRQDCAAAIAEVKRLDGTRGNLASVPPAAAPPVADSESVESSLVGGAISDNNDSLSYSCFEFCKLGCGRSLYDGSCYCRSGSRRCGGGATFFTESAR